MAQNRDYEGVERQRVDAVTWLVAQHGPAAATKALLHAFVREHDGESIAAQFFIEDFIASSSSAGRSLG